MTARMTYILACDHPGCDEDFMGFKHQAGETRVFAKSKGWAYFAKYLGPGGCKSVDLCPTHADQDALAQSPDP